MPIKMIYKCLKILLRTNEAMFVALMKSEKVEDFLVLSHLSFKDKLITCFVLN